MSTELGTEDNTDISSKVRWFFQVWCFTETHVSLSSVSLNKGCNKTLTQTLSPLFFWDGDFHIQCTTLLSRVQLLLVFTKTFIYSGFYTEGSCTSFHRSKRRFLSYSRMHVSDRKQNCCGTVLVIACASFFKEKPVTDRKSVV